MSKTNKIILSIVVVIIVLSVFLSNQFKTKEMEIIKIGAILPLSGSGNYWGQAVLKGINLAVKEIGNSSIRVIVEDNQSNPRDAVSAANKLINMDKVDIIYSEFSGLTAAISPIVRENNKVLIYSAFNPDILKDNLLAIKTFIDYKDVCDKFGIWAKKQKIEKLVIVSEFAGADEFCKDGLLNNYEETSITIINNLADRDFKTIILRLKQDRIGAVILQTYESTSLRFIKEKEQFDFDAILFGDKQDYATNKNMNLLGKEAYNKSIYFEASISEDFKTKIRNYDSNITVDDLQPASFSYDAINKIGQAFGKCYKKEGELKQCIFNSILSSNIDNVFERSYFKDRSIIIPIDFFQMLNSEELRINM